MSVLRSPTFDHDPMPPASWKDVRRLLLGIVVSLVVFNAAARWFLTYHSPDRTPRVTRAKWALASEAKPGTDWLILGDSSGLRGVVPTTLNAQLGVRSVNLCTTRRMLAVADAWMLTRYLQRHSPPRGILLVHTYEIWHGDRDWLVAAMPDLPLPWGFWNRLDPPLRLRMAEQVSAFLIRHVPLVGDNEALAQAFQYPWKVKRHFFSIGVDENGYMPIARGNPRQVEQARRLAVEAVRGRTFHLSELNRQALQRIRELAETRGFDIYLANSPMYEGLYRDPGFQAYFRQVQQELRAFAATSPRIHYIAQEPWTFPKDQMEDCDHVTAPASQEFTRKLAEEILQLRAASAQR